MFGAALIARPDPTLPISRKMDLTVTTKGEQSSELD
jgi:hypothetical protein